MKASQNCFLLSKYFEGCKLVAYKDGGGIWTLGSGTTFYPDNKPVKQGDTCTASQAEAWFMGDLKEAEDKVLEWVHKDLLQNQFDACVSFAYNRGYSKTLFNMINADPQDKAIWGAFAINNKIRNPKTEELEPSLGLTRRRNAEAHLYFRNELHYYEEIAHV